MTITGMTRTGGTVSATTATAHGFSAGQSVTITASTDASFNGVYTLVTVPTGTTYTLTQPGAADQAVSQTGTVVGTKEVIVISTNTGTSGELGVQCAFWYPVPTGKELAVPGRSSAFDRATADETAALQAGRIIEEGRSYQVPNSYTNLQIEAYLQAMYTAHLAYVNSQIPTGQYHGAFWNGSAWGQA